MPFRASLRASSRASKGPTPTSSGCRLRPCRYSYVSLHRRGSRAILTFGSSVLEVLMTHRYIKIGITALVLVSAFTFLMWTTLRDGAEYFKHVDEVVADRQALQGKQLQLHGYVIPGSIQVGQNPLEIWFQVQNNPIRAGEPGHVMSVSYSGIVHVKFQGEADVVLKGTMSDVGILCYSKGDIS